MFFYFLDNVFLLHFALEPAQRIFQRLTFLNTNLGHLDFTVLPMHAAMIAICHYRCERNILYMLVGTHFYRTRPSMSSFVFQY